MGKECAKQGVQWKGCPPGTKECTNGKAGTCGKDAADCKVKVGCEEGKVFCGFLRDKTTGKPTMDETTGKPLANCKLEAECKTGRDRPPKDTTKMLNPAAAGELKVLSDDGKQAMGLRMGKGSFTVGGRAQAVNFSIAAVPDSLMQEGAFGTLFASGALLASLIQIEPSAEVEIAGGMVLDIPILDEEANKDAATCALVLANTKMLSISDITNLEEKPVSMGKCSMGQIGVCSCAVNVTHFSTYGVVDEAVAYEERQVTIAAIAGTTNTTNGTALSDAAGYNASPTAPTMLILTSLVSLLLARSIET